MIGNDTLSMFQLLPDTAGATRISAAGIAVTPSGGTANPALLFSTTAQASANQILEEIFTYRISGNSITSGAIALANSTFTGNGAVTDLQNLCEGGIFGSDGVSGCTGHADGMVTIASVQATDSARFPGAAFLSVTDDFTLDSGGTGTASGGSFTDSFTAAGVTAVPEPGALSLLGLGVGLIGFCRKRFAPKAEHQIKGVL